MHRPRRLPAVAAALVATLLVATSPDVAAARPSPRRAPPGAGSARILVTFAPGAAMTAVASAHRAAGARPVRSLAAVRTHVVAVDDAETALAAYRARPDVEWAGRDGTVHALHHVADNQFSRQWNLHDRTAAPGSVNWHPVYGSSMGDGVVVAVVDTGVGLQSAENDGFEKPFAPGADFVTGDGAPFDEDGHGTHIAGTIAQTTGNATTPAGYSVAGIAADAQIMPVRVLDADGAGSVSDTVAGIIWAANHGADVINLSLGGAYAQPLCDAVTHAVSRGALVVAATGNESSAGLVPATYPAACHGALAVGANQFDGNRAAYSNGGCETAVTAPGGDFADDPTGSAQQPLTDDRNGILQESFDGDEPFPLYRLFHDNGTSMAAAHVAGAAAVLMGAPYNLSATDTARILRATARDTGAPGQDDEHGAGVVDVTAAVAAAQAGSAASVTDRLGYWMVASDGGIFSFGDAPFLGSTGDLTLNSPIVGMARTPTGRGYWLAAADGGIFAFGDAPFHGSAGGKRLAAPVVAMAAYPNGNGYWLAGADGHVEVFGENRHFGGLDGVRLNQPIVGIAPTRSGLGYWLVAADGGIFSFGDARFMGSTGGMRLNAPIVGIARTPSGGGYWLVATDGGIFSFGDAAFHGSTGAMTLNRPILGMVPTCYGGGYWLVASDGGVFSFGAAPFLGSTGNIRLNRPMVGAQLAIDHRAAQL